MYFNLANDKILMKFLKSQKISDIPPFQKSIQITECIGFCFFDEILDNLFFTQKKLIK